MSFETIYTRLSAIGSFSWSRQNLKFLLFLSKFQLSFLSFKPLHCLALSLQKLQQWWADKSVPLPSSILVFITRSIASLSDSNLIAFPVSGCRTEIERSGDNWAGFASSCNFLRCLFSSPGSSNLFSGYPSYLLNLNLISKSLCDCLIVFDSENKCGI